MSIEQTLVLVKPDGVRRALVGEIIRRIEAKGYERQTFFALFTFWVSNGVFQVSIRRTL